MRREDKAEMIRAVGDFDVATHIVTTLEAMKIGGDLLLTW